LARRGVFTRASHATRAHWPVLCLVVIATVLRVLVALSFHPVLWFFGDSAAYLEAAVHPAPYVERPIGGSLLWALLVPTHNLAAIAALQHLLGLVGAIAVYIALRRLGLPRWAATLTVAPLLLDGLELALEQTLVAEPVFIVLECLMFALLIGARARPGIPVVLAAGLCAGATVVTRSVGAVLVVGLLAVLLIRRVGVVRIAVAGAAAALPILAYAGWYQHDLGAVALTQSSGHFLYGRVSPFADCHGLALPPAERVLCDPRPVAQHGNIAFYTWSGQSPYYKNLPSDRPTRERLTTDFSRRVILHQPGAYLDAVLTSIGSTVTTTAGNSHYLFQPNYLALPGYAAKPAKAFQGGRPANPEVNATLAPALTDYQRVATVPGWLYALAAFVGVAGVAFGREPGTHRLRSWTLFDLWCGLGMLVLPSLAAGYDARYLAPALAPLCLGAALGGWLLIHRVRERRSGSTHPKPRATAGALRSAPADPVPSGSS